MKLWAVVFFVLPFIGIAYTFWHLWHLLPLGNTLKSVVLGLLFACILLLFANFAFLGRSHLPLPLATAAYEVGNSSLFILLYAVMLFLVLDLGRLVHIVPRHWLVASWQGTAVVAGVLVATFTYAYFNYMHKVRVPMLLPTEKHTGGAKTVVMLSDLHIGYHNRRGELARWIDMINAERPDLVLIGGDILDGHLRPVLDQHMAEEFRRLKAPVYACLGNHEYYGGEREALQFYRDAGIHLLRDEAAVVCDLNIIGRDDRTNRSRKSLSQLMQGVDRSRYTILLDHQPYHLEEAEQQGVDFQFSGHTHYGQVWPVSWIEDAMYEDAYGHHERGRTRYYVTSGMGIWGAKFRIGTRSEYVVATIGPAGHEAASNGGDR